MELEAHINKILYWIALVAVGLLALSVGVHIWSAATPKVATGTCNSFGSYGDIEESFKNGNAALDRDNDGIPCESRK